MPAPHRLSVTDSPWFWVLMFSGMALAALVAIGPKYGGRQARLERQYQARERIAERRDANNETARVRTGDQAERRDLASAGETLVPLWPLALLLSVVVILSVIMLVRERRRPGSLEQDNLA